MKLVLSSLQGTQYSHPLREYFFNHVPMNVRVCASDGVAGHLYHTVTLPIVTPIDLTVREYCALQN